MNKLLYSIILVLSVGLAGCDYNEGGAEEVGENIDNAYQDAANSVEDVCEDVKEGVNAKDTDC